MSTASYRHCHQKHWGTSTCSFSNLIIGHPLQMSLFHIVPLRVQYKRVKELASDFRNDDSLQANRRALHFLRIHQFSSQNADLGNWNSKERSKCITSLEERTPISYEFCSGFPFSSIIPSMFFAFPK